MKLTKYESTFVAGTIIFFLVGLGGLAYCLSSVWENVDDWDLWPKQDQVLCVVSIISMGVTIVVPFMYFAGPMIYHAITKS